MHFQMVESYYSNKLQMCDGIGGVLLSVCVPCIIGVES